MKKENFSSHFLLIFAYAKVLSNSYLCLSFTKMDRSQSAQELSKVSMEKIINSVRQTRDNLIAELLHEPALMSFLEKEYDIVAISPIKLEFLKRDLKELQNSPLELVYYSSMIKQMKESNSDVPLDSHPLFHQELKTIFQKYGL
jgi:hypothetical protein